MAFAPDGKTLATRAKNGDIVLWDYVAGKARVTIPTPADWVDAAPFGATPSEQALAFTPDSAVLVFRWRQTNGNGGAQAWDAATGRPRCPPIKLGGPEDKICLSPDGRWLVTCNGATLQKRDARTGDPVGALLEGCGHGHLSAFQLR